MRPTLPAVVVCMALTTVTLVAQSGRGTLEGTWTFSTLTPLERPAEFAGRPAIADGEAQRWVAQVLERNIATAATAEPAWTWPAP